ncbi:hypothetical protein EMIT0P294_30569 [Pseudomonas sp. IT-P294]|jgi:hypothetical protein
MRLRCLEEYDESRSEGANLIGRDIVIARKDYEDRHRQGQGIERAQKTGVYAGRPS